MANDTAPVARTRKAGNHHVRWSELSPCEHLVQLYEHEEALFDTLQGFLGDGLLAGESAVVIATPAHCAALDTRLAARGIYLPIARREDRYITLDAEQTLARFMVNGWPDEVLFQRLVVDVLARATRNRRRVRAFGEMVALLWARGEHGATARLEQLWQGLCESMRFQLLCAYPRTGFTHDVGASIRRICDTHSRVITA